MCRSALAEPFRSRAECEPLDRPRQAFRARSCERLWNEWVGQVVLKPALEEAELIAVSCAFASIELARGSKEKARETPALDGCVNRKRLEIRLGGWEAVTGFVSWREG